MNNLGRIDSDSLSPAFEYVVEWHSSTIKRLYIVDQFLVFCSQKTYPNGKTISTQSEFPLLALDWILATLARYKLPPNLGGYSGFDHGDKKQFSENDLLVVSRSLNNPYGVPIYTISNHLREDYTTGLSQEWDFFEETLEGGLLKFLTELNEQYKNGELG